MYYSQQQIHPRVYRFCKAVLALPLCPKIHYKMHQIHYHYMKWYHVAVLTLQHGCSITSPVHSVDAAEHCTKIKILSWRIFPELPSIAAGGEMSPMSVLPDWAQDTLPMAFHLLFFLEPSLRLVTVSQVALCLVFLSEDFALLCFPSEGLLSVFLLYTDSICLRCCAFLLHCWGDC